jgi:hypothetical protein
VPQSFYETGNVRYCGTIPITFSNRVFFLPLIPYSLNTAHGLAGSAYSNVSYVIAPQGEMAELWAFW